MNVKKLLSQNLSLNARLIALVAVMLAVSIGNVIVTFSTVDKQKNDALCFNLAGRQRMLSQKYAKEFLDETNLGQVSAAAEKNASALTRQIVAGPRCPKRLSMASPTNSAITTTIKETQPVNADNPANVRFFVRGECFCSDMTSTT